jgi:prenyltransferase beta subunit
MNSAILTLALLAPTQPADQFPPDVRDTVHSGLKWLAEQQKDDGSWTGVNNASPTTFTATAGLAFLMEGSTPKAGKYAPQLRRAITWMEKNAQKSGCIGGRHPAEVGQYLPSHANALLFLVCVADVDDDTDRVKRVRAIVENAIAFVAEGQTSRGGWGLVRVQDSENDNGIQTTAVLQALFAARKAGFDVPKAVTEKAVQYLTKATNREGGIIYSIYGGVMPQGRDGQPQITAAAAAGLLMFDGVRPDVLPRWIRNANTESLRLMVGVRNTGSFGLFQQYQMARACFALGESGHAKMEPDLREKDLVKWSAYRARLFKEIKTAQRKDGSWADIYVGPVYSTSLALIILQLDNDYLPAFSR